MSSIGERPRDPRVAPGRRRDEGGGGGKRCRQPYGPLPVPPVEHPVGGVAPQGPASRSPGSPGWESPRRTRPAACWLTGTATRPGRSPPRRCRPRVPAGPIRRSASAESPRWWAPGRNIEPGIGEGRARSGAGKGEPLRRSGPAARTMSWVSPTAPADDTTAGSSALSSRMRACRRSGGTPAGGAKRTASVAPRGGIGHLPYPEAQAGGWLPGAPGGAWARSNRWEERGIALARSRSSARRSSGSGCSGLPESSLRSTAFSSSAAWRCESEPEENQRRAEVGIAGEEAGIGTGTPCGSCRRVAEPRPRARPRRAAPGRAIRNSRPGNGS